MKLYVDEVMTEKLTPNSWNPNEMDGKTREHLKTEMQRVGFVVPIIAMRNNIIIDGEHRWDVARELGFDTVPVVHLDITEAQAKTLTVNLNQIKGELNQEKMAIIVQSLESEFPNEEIQKIFNYTNDELNNLLKMVQEQPKIEFADKVSKEETLYKELNLVLSSLEYQLALEKLNSIKNDKNLQRLEDAFMELIR